MMLTGQVLEKRYQTPQPYPYEVLGLQRYLDRGIQKTLNTVLAGMQNTSIPNHGGYTQTTAGQIATNLSQKPEVKRLPSGY